MRWDVGWDLDSTNGDSAKSDISQSIKGIGMMQVAVNLRVTIEVQSMWFCRMVSLGDDIRLVAHASSCRWCIKD
jgi:hypothetical protein